MSLSFAFPETDWIDIAHTRGMNRRVRVYFISVAWWWCYELVLVSCWITVLVICQTLLTKRALHSRPQRPSYVTLFCSFAVSSSGTFLQLQRSWPYPPYSSGVFFYLFRNHVPYLCLSSSSLLIPYRPCRRPQFETALNLGFCQVHTLFIWSPDMEWSVEAYHQVFTCWYSPKPVVGITYHLFHHKDNSVLHRIDTANIYSFGTA